MKEVQLAIIGSGPGGYVAGIRAGQLGLKAVVIEKEALGGVCLNVGCIPTKALLHASHIYSAPDEARRMGIKFAGVEVDLKKLNGWKKSVVKRLVSGVDFLLKNNGTEVIYGEARLVGKNEILVKGGDGEEIRIKADSIILATGSRPSFIPGFEPDHERIWDSTDALEIKFIPDRFLVIGAGAVGLEFASIYARFGSRVTVVEIMDQIVPGSDSEAARMLERALKKQGIEILTSSRVVSREGEGPFRVKIEKEGKEDVREFDAILVATGRKPNTSGIGLEEVGVQLDERGFVRVNERLQTSVENIYAIGDITGPPLLAHKASRQGIAAVEIIAGLETAYDVRAIPAVVYTYPEFAMVGMTEGEALERGHDIKVGKFPLTANGRAIGMNMTEGFAKIIADAKTDEILGVHIVAPEASSMIAEGALAIEMMATAEDVGLTVHPHPTLSEILMEAAENVHRRAIHILNK